MPSAKQCLSLQHRLLPECSWRNPENLAELPAEKEKTRVSKIIGNLAHTPVALHQLLRGGVHATVDEPCSRRTTARRPEHPVEITPRELEMCRKIARRAFPRPAQFDKVLEPSDLSFAERALVRLPFCL